MGFFGHTIRGDFNPAWAIPLAAVPVLRGLLGGRFSIRMERDSLKRLFAHTTLAAAAFMVFNALLST